MELPCEIMHLIIEYLEICHLCEYYTIGLCSNCNNACSHCGILTQREYHCSDCSYMVCEKCVWTMKDCYDCNDHFCDSCECCCV